MDPKIGKKGIQKWMPKPMPKKRQKLCQKAPKTTAKWTAKWLTNRSDFVTCDSLFLTKSITLKSFFYMISCTEHRPKSVQNQCKIEVRNNYAKINQNEAKMEAKWTPKSSQNNEKEPKVSQRAAQITKKTGKKECKQLCQKLMRIYAEMVAKWPTGSGWAGPRPRAGIRKGVAALEPPPFKRRECGR